MPRAGTHLSAGSIFHVTHRCHNRSFLLKFAKHRNLYQKYLREELARKPVSLLGYCITSNHVHLLVRVECREELGHFMRDLAARFAKTYNRRTSRQNAVWGGRYHAVLVEEGSYLFRCLVYLEMNMVRAGVVEHPSDWKWCSFQEHSGTKKRYRMVDRGVLLRCLGHVGCLGQFQKHYLATIEQRIAARDWARELEWTESLAVGTRAFVAKMARTINNRRELQFSSEASSDEITWAVKEASAEYC